MPDNQDLGGQAQAIRDMLDGKLPPADQRKIFEPPVEDNQPPVQRASNPPLVDPGTYQNTGVK
jgi:hypothetical protein